MKLLIDAHLDLAWNALSWNRDITQSISHIREREAGMADHNSRGRCTTSLPELRRAGVAVCLATILVRSKPEVQPRGGHQRIDLDHATQDIAYAVGRGQLAYYRLLEERGEVRFITSQAQLAAHWAQWQQADRANLPIGLILAMEGADPITTPGQAEAWWHDGLRSAGLVHYGKGPYGVGTGDTGPLTPEGVELLRAFRRLGMMLDLTHMSDQGFYQAMDLFDGPVMASHNNCRALVPNGRQFTDEQITMLIERDAVIGCAMDAWMLKPGFKIGESTNRGITLAAVVDHIDRICQLAGNTRHAAVGSDLDGGFGAEQSPCDLDSIADVQKLAGLLRERGYDDEAIDNIFHANWLRFFSKHLPQNPVSESAMRVAGD